MQVLATGADVAERALASPDAVGDAAYGRESGGEGQPAGQRGALAGVQVVAQHAPQPGEYLGHGGALPARDGGNPVRPRAAVHGARARGSAAGTPAAGALTESG